MRAREIVLPAIGLLVACGGGDGGNGTGVIEPASITLIAGDDQTGPAGVSLPLELEVEVLGANGEPATGATVVFTQLEGSGMPGLAQGMVGSNGRVTTGWIMGPTPGEQQRLRASANGFTVEFTAESTAPVLDADYEARRGYIEWEVGDLPLIVVASHAGTRFPSEIPTRASQDTATDTNADDLAVNIADEIERRTGMRPHVITNELSRSKVDMDLPEDQATDEDAGGYGQHAWREYHMMIEAAKAYVASHSDFGLLMDLHGHQADSGRVELGYLLTANQLAQGDAQLDGLAAQSSFRVAAAASPQTFAQLIRGPNSLGTVISANQFPNTVPSMAMPNAGAIPYASGGYTVQRHGSLNGGIIDAVQVETPLPGVRDVQANRGLFSLAIINAYLALVAEHYGAQPPR